MQVEAVLARPQAAFADRVHPHRAEVDLDVRAFQRRIASQVRDRVHGEHGKRTPAQEEVLGQGAREAQGVAVAVEGDRLPALVLDEGSEVVLQPLAHRGKRVAGRDAELSQRVGGADAGEHQELRGLVGAGAHQHFALRPDLAALAARRTGTRRPPPGRLRAAPGWPGHG